MLCSNLMKTGQNTRRTPPRAAIEAEPNVSLSKKQKKIRALGFDPNWISNVSYLWGPGITAPLYHVDGVADLAAIKLENLNLPADQQFPRFGRADVELSQGTSLCKLGFPFHEFKAQFDLASSQFITNDPVTFVRYPLDGILTRYINFEAPDKSRTAKFVEMSSPGLRGQSAALGSTSTAWFGVFKAARSILRLVLARRSKSTQKNSSSTNF